ncbi:MAG: response regulator transcription factor [Chloroflexi bacterium]|nr:response regulator transcription factor [Chloroflexota bacterium]
MGELNQAQTSLRILAVDDEPNIVEFLRVGLGYEGYQVEVAMDGRAALDRLRQEEFDLVILDVMLPGVDGFEICKRIRANSRVPILMLTARDEISDRVTGLDLGADDYLIKPFSFAELLARIRAILRGRGVTQEHAILRAADIALDRDAHTVERAGNPITLTAKEFELLEFFLTHPRQVFRRDVILDRVWGYDFAGDTNLVDVHIGHLRDKLGDRPPQLLRTVRGVGYVWRED